MPSPLQRLDGMSLSWAERKDILTSLLQARGDDDEGIALDRVLHGQNTIGRTCKCSFLRVGKSCDRSSQFIAAKTIKIDSLRFTDKDLLALGTLDRGQFGVVCPITYARGLPTEFGLQIDVVNCVLDGRVYVRKSVERAFALRSREVSYINGQFSCGRFNVE